MKVKLYLVENRKRFDSHWSEQEVFKEIEIEDNIDLWHTVIKVDDKFYSIRSICKNNTRCLIKEIEVFNINENIDDLYNYGEDNIKCPICNYQDKDSWEEDEDENDNYICPVCGAKLLWNREITITYDTQVVEKSNYKEL